MCLGVVSFLFTLIDQRLWIAERWSDLHNILVFTLIVFSCRKAVVSHDFIIKATITSLVPMDIWILRIKAIIRFNWQDRVGVRVGSLRTAFTYWSTENFLRLVQKVSRSMRFACDLLKIIVFVFVRQQNLRLIERYCNVVVLFKLWLLIVAKEVWKHFIFAARHRIILRLPIPLRLRESQLLLKLDCVEPLGCLAFIR